MSHYYNIIKMAQKTFKTLTQKSTVVYLSLNALHTLRRSCGTHYTTTSVRPSVRPTDRLPPSDRTTNRPTGQPTASIAHCLHFIRVVQILLTILTNFKLTNF
ncbi:hypothetical protein O3G_MSEX004577 [Manduca sexta]|uniref:Uncharacterized protein n=1 Tax=Manduca sexta TaxID=7130 RepID=A0A922CHV2_MANSE|nr:hypothetical protein O3G_MSEX004577 [Manduca sexta]